MNIILLSGGSGKRLWPLSNNLRSKQFLKVLHNDKGKPESMIQRVYRQISNNCEDCNVVVATGKNQYDSIVNQLSYNVDVVLEPERRDTFPAIALACCYLHYKKGMSLEESVIIMPVDPYANDEYFSTMNVMYQESQKNSSELVLMGIKPTYPSAKYGYIIPENDDKGIISVKRFAEKPTEEEASRMIDQENALWNGGVFSLKIRYIIDKLRNYIDFNSFKEVYNQYGNLKKTSFDYEVVEKAENIKAIMYDGTWKDLGTWNTLTEVMKDQTLGNVIKDDKCDNTHIINELKIPVTVMGIKNAVIALSPDGVLISDKHESSYIKPYVEKIESIPMYGEKRWGDYKVLNYSSANNKTSLTRLIRMKSEQSLSYHKHSLRDEIWNVVFGQAQVILGDCILNVKQGDSIKIPKNTYHSIKAISDIEMLEVQIGCELTNKDKKVKKYSWNEVKK